MKKVVVIGAGPAGLTAVYELLKEKNDKNKGCMISCPIFEAYKKSHDY